MEASVDPQPPGSRLDADHPENGVDPPKDVLKGDEGGAKFGGGGGRKWRFSPGGVITRLQMTTDQAAEAMLSTLR